MNILNEFLIKYFLNSNKSIDLSKYSRKDLELFINISIQEYRHLKKMYDIMIYLDDKKGVKK